MTTRRSGSTDANIGENDRRKIGRSNAARLFKLGFEMTGRADAMEIVTSGAANLGLFIGAALVLLLVPGPAVLYIVARSVEQGRVAGFVSDLGIHAATLVHVLAAALGLSALLASSALAFSVVKYVGAAYLVLARPQKDLRSRRSF